MRPLSHDRTIIAWAAQRNAPWYYTNEAGLPGTCLKVHCGAVTAYFRQGQLARLWAQADASLLDEAFEDMVDIFRLSVPRTPQASPTHA